MGGSAQSKFLTAPAPANASAPASSSGRGTSIDERIAASQCHWSELTESDSTLGEEEVAAENEKEFRNSQRHPVWGAFFQTFGYSLGVYESLGELVVGEKFAQGAQAELFLTQIKWRDPRCNDGIEYVLKVFNKGTLLRDFVSKWPPGMLHFHAEIERCLKLGLPLPARFRCDVVCVVLLEDGRFAFLMEREEEDLRSLIDRHVVAQGGNGSGPFSKEKAEEIMYRVACGMDWLCKYDIVHRDLKASNILVTKLAYGSHACFVADYECSVGVVGTGLWRAPEILQACKERNVSQRPELFTAAADAYGYGMVCYEILTGKLPFEGHVGNGYDLVLSGQRPELPQYVDENARELLCWCWQNDPAARPSSAEIITFLEANFNSPYIRWAAFARKHEWDFLSWKFFMKAWIMYLFVKVKNRFMKPRTSLRLLAQLVISTIFTVLRLLFRAVAFVILLLGCAVSLVILLLASAVLFVILVPARFVLEVISGLVVSILMLSEAMAVTTSDLLLGR